MNDAGVRASTRRVAIVGAGPVGLTLALLLSRHVRDVDVCVFDARAIDHDVSGDARTLALALGSVQLLQRLEAWDGARAQPITTVHVSQHAPALPWLGTTQASVTMHAHELQVPMLGAVMPYGALVAPLRRAWLDVARREGSRHGVRFGERARALKPLDEGRVEVDAATAEAFDLVVVAEGGVFADHAGDASVHEPARPALTHDYAQTAWVGTLQMADDAPVGLAVERFTRHGPAALLPLPAHEGRKRAALVWCVDAHDDPVRGLDDAQRVAVLGTIFPREVGRILALDKPLKPFALGLTAERTLVDTAAAIVRIGNAAQTLHPVAGQGLNLGLRDAHALVDALRGQPGVSHALRRVEWARAVDRWSLIAGTDFLARSFTWRWPGVGSARAGALALLDRAPSAKRLLARGMMFGSR